MLKAIVIGVEHYADIPPGGAIHTDVRGAAREALNFYDWLLEYGEARRKHSHENEWIAPEEIALHLSASGVPLPPHAKPAAARPIKESFRALRQAAGLVPRIFVYFNGHGFSTTTSFNGSTADYIACADFATAEDLVPAIRIDRIKEYLARMGKCQQYLFMDCCRNEIANMPLEGGYIYNTPPDSTQSKSRQMLLYAARPGETAAAESMFSRSLLRALRGTGTAKVVRQRRLIVDFDSVRRFVEQEMEDAEAPAPEPEGASFGELYTIAPMPKYPCGVEVVGETRGGRFEAAARQGSARTAPEPLDGNKGMLVLEPDSWSIEVRDVNLHYDVEPAAHEVDLFDPTTIVFRAKPRAGAQFGGLESMSHDEGPVWSDESIPIELVYPPETSLEMLGPRGELLGTRRLAEDRVEAFVPPGRYDVQLTQAGRLVHRQQVTIETHGSRVVQVTPTWPASPLRRSLVEMTGGTSFMPSEGLGRIWDGRLSLWLASVMSKAAVGRPHYSLQRVNAGIPIASEGTVYFALATPGPPRVEGLSGVTTLLEMIEITEGSGLWAGAVRMPVGGSLLTWQVDGIARSVASCVLPHRATVVVAAETPDEARFVQQFFVVPEAVVGQLPEDQRPIEPTVASIRALLNAQESFAMDQGIGAGPGFVDPLWELLAAYEAWREAKQDLARVHVDRLLEHFPNIPDAPYLARALQMKGPSPKGIPMLAEGAALLAASDGELAALAREASWSTAWTTWNRPVSPSDCLSTASQSSEAPGGNR